MKSPSTKQIEFADEIAYVLGIDFPRGDYDFTAQAYWEFIQANIREYKE